MDKITADVLRASIHQLKGPAGRMHLLAQLLGRSLPELDDDARALLGHIEASAAGVGFTADGLERYLNIFSHPIEREPLDLAVPLAAAIRKLKGEFEIASAEVTYTGLPAVNVDGFLITCLFHELLTNALRHRSAEPLRVNVWAGAADDGMQFIAISDNGQGIEKGMEERIFRPFEALGAPERAGLGLTICRKIVDVHGGRIWVEPGSTGAQFRFSLSAG